MALIGKGRQLVINLKEGFLANISSANEFINISQNPSNEGRLFYVSFGGEVSIIVNNQPVTVTVQKGIYYHDGTRLREVNATVTLRQAEEGYSPYNVVVPFAVGDTLERMAFKIDSMFRRFVPPLAPDINSVTPSLSAGNSSIVNSSDLYLVQDNQLLSLGSTISFRVILISSNSSSTPITSIIGSVQSDGQVEKIFSFLYNANEKLRFSFQSGSNQVDSIYIDSNNLIYPPSNDQNGNLRTYQNLVFGISLNITEDTDSHYDGGVVQPFFTRRGRFANTTQRGAVGFSRELVAVGTKSNVQPISRSILISGSGLLTSALYRVSFRIVSQNQVLRSSPEVLFDVARFNSNFPSIFSVSNTDPNFTFHNFNSTIGIVNSAKSSPLTPQNIVEYVSGVPLLKQNIVVRFYISQINRIFFADLSGDTKFVPRFINLNPQPISGVNFNQTIQTNELMFSFNDIIKADLSITRSDVLENVVLAAHFTNSCMHSNDEPTITYSPSAVGVTSQSIQYRMNGILVDYPSIVTKNNEQTIPFGITGKRYLSLNSTLNNNFSDDRNIFSNINLTTEYDANRHSFQLNSGRYNYELQIRRGEYVYPSENRTFSYTYSSQNLVSNINYSNLSGISPNSIFENREMSYLVDSLKSTNFRYATFRFTPPNGYISVGKVTFYLNILGKNLYEGQERHRVLVFVLIRGVTGLDEVWLSLNGPVDRFQSSILHLSPAISTVQYDNPEPGIQRIKFSFSYYQGGSAKQVGSISNPHYVWVRFGIPQGYNVSVSKIELPITQG